MALSIGIVGLPNVGKSTLFTALTKRQGLAANYPFATIDPNVGIVDVPDKRLQKLANIVKTNKIVPATVEFIDIAGLVEGASEGEGRGNQFLANIRECDAICEVVRYFKDPEVTHVDGKVDPESDVETISMELILADLGTIEKARPKVEKEARGNSKDAKLKLSVIDRLIDWFNEGKPARTLEMTKDEELVIRDLHLLTMKPMIILANVDEDMIGADLDTIQGMKPIPVCAQIESELVELEDDEAEAFLEDLGIEDAGLSTVIRAAYKILGLQSYFTAGEVEVHAWTIPIGAKAPQAAGEIHTDFERGFIKAEVISYDDFIKYEGEAGAKAAGKLRMEGKEYIVQDGDVIHFRFNV